ncbi:hypothetical protein [Ectobacillus panaciterrae]|uniref:hypothetical protein n=1 Tax=Ectobacillus panaciterrae TaxID=363872 RepID=UPI000411F372|nr:hypothetical protein [Ectobacillus panaciterrae]
MKKTIFLLLLFLSLTSGAMAQTSSNVEIFDVNKGRIMKKIPANEGIQKEASSYLKEITAVYNKLSPLPNEGYMIKIPLEPAFRMQNQWLYSVVDEVIVIYNGHEKPYLMVLDDENSPYFFTFNKDTNTLLKQLKFQPKAFHKK